ncbi:hypothetical protein AVEN_163870-1 [Araneus ventricosus]|uniref:Uncharacterized protein n=1 Tax=Araneus ventricosus TaxID=182803 RepID=A0A4Y2HA96_ARAVE|nr:hypothetical protein AVEN_163870-1 [Araneus ventricosus]
MCSFRQRNEETLFYERKPITTDSSNIEKQSLDSLRHSRKNPKEIIQSELKRVVKKTPTKIIGPPTTLINEDIFLPDHTSKEGKRLKPAVRGVKAEPDLARDERFKPYMI